MSDFRLFLGIDGFFVEVVYVVGTWDGFADEGLMGLYSCLLRARMGLGIGGVEVRCGRYDDHCR